MKKYDLYTTNKAPLISVVICTYNNADLLGKILSELALCGVPEKYTIELICVDNNSSDHTRAVYERVFPKISFSSQYLFEAKQGLSCARNLGLSKAVGEYVLFTDDDAKIPADWIMGYVQHIESEHPDCRYSKKEVIWDRPIPSWHLDKYQSFFCLFRLWKQSPQYF